MIRVVGTSWIAGCSIFIALLLSNSASASEDSSWYYGTSAGLKVLNADCCETDSALNIAGVIGIDLRHNLAVEVQLSDSIIDGEFNDFDMSVRSIAAYVSYRTQSSTYFKCKLGVANTMLSIENIENDETDMAFGIGIGIKFARGHKLELEYSRYDTIQDGDLSFFSISYLF